MRSAHRMFITYIHRTSESRNTKTLTTSWFRYETFYYLWVKGFDIRKRDTHSFYSGFSICLPPLTHTHIHTHVWHPPQSHWPGFGEQAKANRLLPRQNSTQLTFSKSPKSSACFRCVTSLALTSPVSHLGYCDISEWHVRSACTREDRR